MGKWVFYAACILLSFGAVMQSLSYFNLIPNNSGYTPLLISALILSPWLPALLLFFAFNDSLGTKKSKGTEFAMTLFVIIFVYAVFLSPLMPWFSHGTYPFLGMIGFVFPFVVSATVLLLIKGFYNNATKVETTENS